MLSALHRIYRDLRYGEPIVVVSGLPRSGTSMTMKMLDAGGLSPVADGLRTADEDNPKGYFEDERVKDLAKMADKGWLRAARGKVIKVISFLLKDLPRTNNYRVLFMRRNVEEVIASQNKMLERRGETNDTPDERARELLEQQLWRADYLMKHEPCFEFIDVHYREVLERPLEQAERMARFLGRPLDTEKMAQVVDPELYRNRR